MPGHQFNETRATGKREPLPALGHGSITPRPNRRGIVRMRAVQHGFQVVQIEHQRWLVRHG
jgi:hypothetical protein